MEPGRIYYKQFESSFTECCRYISEHFPPEDKKPWVQLYKLRSSKGLAKIHVVATDDYDQANFDSSLSLALDQIDLLDPLKYREGIDPESTSFKYQQGISEFKFRYKVSKLKSFSFLILSTGRDHAQQQTH